MIAHKLRSLTLACLLALAGGQASAALFFEQQAGFDPTSYTEFDATLQETFSGLLGAGYPAGVVSDISWNFPGDNVASGLNITTYNDNGVGDATGGTSPSNGNVALGDTNGDGLWDQSEWFTITRLTQTNNVISGFGDPLWGLDGIANLEFFSDAAHTTLFDADLNNVTRFNFSETQNSAPCVPNQTGTICEDFYLTLLADFAPLIISDGTDSYRIDFRVISPDGSALIDTVGGNLRIITSETAPGISIADIQIHHTRIPEPAMLALMGLGLAGLGFTRRRRTM